MSLPLVLTSVSQVENELLKWCKKQWEKKKVTMRGIIYYCALEIDPKHCGGKDSQNVFERLKKWFYGGFNKRCKLSKRRISSTGQKLPLDWKEKTSLIIQRVANA